MEELTTIRLSTDDSRLFILFRKHQDKIAILLKNDVFEAKNGKIILHFNQNGQLMKIEKDETLYRFDKN